MKKRKRNTSAIQPAAEGATSESKAKTESPVSEELSAGIAEDICRDILDSESKASAAAENGNPGHRRSGFS